MKSKRFTINYTKSNSVQGMTNTQLSKRYITTHELIYLTICSFFYIFFFLVKIWIDWSARGLFRRTLALVIYFFLLTICCTYILKLADHFHRCNLMDYFIILNSFSCPVSWNLIIDIRQINFHFSKLRPNVDLCQWVFFKRHLLYFVLVTFEV